MPKERRKIIIAGPLWKGAQYTINRSGDPTERRAAKCTVSTPAQEKLNARYSWEKLMLLLACNFEPTDLFVTLSYRDADLPKRRDEADRRLTAFIRALRKVRKAAGQPMPYIRVTEDKHGDARIHHHMIINATGNDYEIIRRLWRKNGDNVDFELFGSKSYEDRAKYLAKEAIELGRRRIGERSWRASLRLKRPVITYMYVPETDALTPPPGFFVLERLESQNCYGRFTTVTAIRQRH